MTLVFLIAEQADVSCSVFFSKVKVKCQFILYVNDNLSLAQDFLCQLINFADLNLVKSGILDSTNSVLLTS